MDYARSNEATFVGQEVITMDELEDFSDDLKEAVKLILRR